MIPIGLRYNGSIIRFSGTPFFTGDGTTASAGLVDRHGNPINSGKVQRVDAIHRTDWQGRQLLYSTGRTNLCPRSSAMNAPGWTLVTGATVAAIDAPDGTSRGSRITAGNSVYSRIQSALIKVAANTAYVASVYLRHADAANSSLAVYNGAVSSTLGRLDIAWSGGVPALSLGSGATNGRAEQIGDGYWRVSFTMTSTGTATDARVLIYPDTSSGTKSLDAFAAQLELAQLTGWIDTAGAAVTVTDYTLTGATATFGETPLAGAVLDWDGVAKR